MSTNDIPPKLARVVAHATTILKGKAGLGIRECTCFTTATNISSEESPCFSKGDANAHLSRNSRRKILPTGDFGNSSLKTIVRGNL